MLQGSAEVMEDDTPTSRRVELKEVFCKLVEFAIRGKNCETIIESEIAVKSWKFTDSFITREVFFQLLLSLSFT